MRNHSVRRYLTLLTAFAIGAIALAAQPRQISRAQERLPTPPSVPVAGEYATSEYKTSNYMGVGSCASPACHGGSAAKEHTWKNSYSVWIEQDKHSKAYSVLYEQRSKDILNNLDRPPKGGVAQPYRDVRCLACHATTKDVSHAGLALAIDGIGCEACHGAAKAWIGEHTSRTWSNNATRYRPSHGDSPDNDCRMVNTKDIKVRAQVCVDCHIGSQAPDGRTSRNMNHDMIAAGHPRLLFEYSAFMANMPHHWGEKDTGADGPPARVWAVGQTVSMQAALRLLAGRANDAVAMPEKAPWPELAEYDCYACHHAITPKSYHLKSAEHSGGKPGQYAWGRWYLPLTESLLNDKAFLPDDELKRQLADVKATMRQPAPLPKVIAAKASIAADGFDVLTLAVAKSPFTEDQTAQLLNNAYDGRKLLTNWDEACGVYLLYRNVYWNVPRLREPLHEVRKTLQFTSDPALPPNKVPTRWNSPRNFDPQAFAAAMNKLRSEAQNAAR